MVAVAAKTIRWICVAVLAAVLVLAGWQGWQIWQSASKARGLPAPEAGAGGPALAEPRQIAQIIPLNLFGEDQPEAEVVEQSTEDLPETNLQLTLRGVSASTEESVGGALIETPDRQTNFFRIGESMPGSVVLHSVYANRVVLDRRGKLENLLFPEISSDNSFVVIYDEEDYQDTGYEEPVYEEPTYEEPVYPEPEYPDTSAQVSPEQIYEDGADQDTPLPETTPAAEALEEERKQQIRERLQRLREQIKQRSQS